MSAYAFALLLSIAQFSHCSTGELHVTVTDASGSRLQSHVELVSGPNQVRERLDTDSSGVLVAKRLPFATYRVLVTHDGFATSSGLVEVRSALPTDYRVTLQLATLQTQVTVTVKDILLDPREAATVHRIGDEALRHRTTALPGRSLPDLVNTQPGWLLEANGILHPRGSEYQTQYVIDGLPLTDSRSPAFASQVDADDVHSMNILTGGYPAEYGRKLGGVIEVVTAGRVRPGFHGSLAASAASFSTKTGDVIGEYGRPRTTFMVSAGVAGTDRYLDPPVEENDTNHGTTSNIAAHFERDFTGCGSIRSHCAPEFYRLPRAERARATSGRATPGSRQPRNRGAVFLPAHFFRARAGRDAWDVARSVGRAVVERRVDADFSAAEPGNPGALPERHGLRPRRRARMEGRRGRGRWDHP
jgi:hypothetical protein